jgi:TP901 family phage tail tape measure protein
MAGPVEEIQRLLVRLVGDDKLYVKTLKESAQLTEKFTQTATGQFRNMEGRFVSTQKVMQAEAARTLLKLQAQGAAIGKLGDVLTKVGQKMKSVGTAMSLRMTAPIVGMGIAGAKTFASYETSLNQMIGLVGLTAGEVQKMDDAIREMGPLVGKGPTELADAMYFITGSGQKGAQAVQVLEASAKAAAAGLGETQVVADAVTSAVNAYGAANLSASRATDVLVAAVREGKVEADQLAPVLGRLLPTASSMKISFQEVAGVMAVMSRTGLDAAEASTSVSSILSTLQKPSKEAAAMLEEAGLSMAYLRDVAKKPGGLVQVMRILSQKFADNEEALATIVPNVRAFRGVMNVLAQDASIVDKIMGGVANSVGATDSAFNAGADTVGRKWAQAMSEFKGALVDLGTAMRPVIESVTNGLKSVSKWFSSLSGESQGFIVKVGILAAALGPVSYIMGSIVSTAGTLATAYRTVTSSAQLMAAAMKALNVVMSLSKAGMIGLGIAITTALIYAINKFHPAAQKMRAEIQKINDLGSAVTEVLDKRFQKMTESISSLPVDQQAAAFKTLQKDVEGSLQQVQIEIEKTKKEISYLSNEDGKRGMLNASLDEQGIELAKAHLEEAKQRAAAFKNQLDQVTTSMKNLGTGSGAGIELPSVSIRPEAIKEFGESLEKQLRDMEIQLGGQQQGLSDELIGRRQAFAQLEAELRESKVELTEEERKRLELANELLVATEKQLKAQEEQKKTAEEHANRAKQIIEESQTSQEKVKKQVEEIMMLQKEGLLTAEQAAAAKAKAEKDAGEKVATAKSATGSNSLRTLETRSAEGYSQIVKSRNQNEMGKIAKQSLDKLTKSERHLAKISEQGVGSSLQPANLGNG